MLYHIPILISLLAILTEAVPSTSRPDGLTGEDVIIQYTLRGDDLTAFRWGGHRTSSGSNSIAAAAVAAADNRIDTQAQIMKIKTHLNPDTIALSGFLEDHGPVNMQSARIIWRRETIQCRFEWMGADSYHAISLAMGNTVEFPIDRGDFPQTRIYCYTLDILVRSELA